MRIYLRMLGYAATILMHFTNIIAMVKVLQTPDAKELFDNDPTVRFFATMQERYFTCWTFFNQIVYAIIGLVCDYLILKNSHCKDYRLPKHLYRLRETYFSAVVWPSTFLVASVFWGLYALDRDLIFPKILDKVLTPISNHVIHTAIVPVVLYELVCRPRKVPTSHWYNLAHILFLYVLYHNVLFYTYSVDGEWIYPVYKYLLQQDQGKLLFCIFMFATWVLLLVYYYAQWVLNSVIHGHLEGKHKIR